MNYVTDTWTKKRHTVNIFDRECDCHDYVAHRQPCRHMCVVFYEMELFGKDDVTTKQTIRDFWPRWAQADVYLQSYRGKAVLRPATYVGVFQGDDTDKILPPESGPKPRGRPRKKRFKKLPRTVETIKKTMIGAGRPLCHPEYQTCSACV